MDKSPLAPNKVYQSIRSPPRYDIELERNWKDRVQTLGPLKLFNPPSTESTNGRLTTFDGVNIDDVDIVIFATSFLIAFPFIHDEDAPFNKFPVIKHPSPPKGSRKPPAELVGNSELGGAHRMQYLLLFIRTSAQCDYEQVCITSTSTPCSTIQIPALSSCFCMPKCVSCTNIFATHHCLQVFCVSQLSRLSLGPSLSCKPVSLQHIGRERPSTSILIQTKTQRVTRSSSLAIRESTLSSHISSDIICYSPSFVQVHIC